VRHPERISNATIRIPVARALNVFVKINTQGAGMIMGHRVDQHGIVCDLDFEKHARHYAFEPGVNTIELRVVPHAGPELFAQWVVVPVEEPPTEASPLALAAAGGTEEPSAASAISALKLFGEFETGQREELQNSETFASKLLIAGRLGHPFENASVSLRRAGGSATALQSGETARRLPAPGTVSSANAVELAMPLEPGSNNLELIVENGNAGTRTWPFSVVRKRPAQPEGFHGQKWAVLIGVSKYRHHENGLGDLEYAARDAQAFREFLLTPQGGAFPPDHVRLLLDEQATNEGIRTALFTFLVRSQPEDFVVVFFSGHGSPDPNNPDNMYLLPHDAKPLNLGGTALPMRDLGALVDSDIKATRALVLADACHSGGALRPTGARSVAQFNLVNKYIEMLGQADGRMIVTASRADEWSLEGERWGGGHGVFSHVLLQGLKGQADSDRDGIVTIGEIVDYVQQAVPKETDGRQHPAARTEGFSGAFPVALTRSAGG